MLLDEPRSLSSIIQGDQPLDRAKMTKLAKLTTPRSTPFEITNVHAYPGQLSQFRPQERAGHGLRPKSLGRKTADRHAAGLAHAHARCGVNLVNFRGGQGAVTGGSLSQCFASLILTP
jgi:hypothetical protein